jgi:hypothetical protein
MRFLQYKDLDLRRVRAAFDKVKAAIEVDDFRSADVKKLNAGPYYRAKLDYANRLLLQFARFAEGEGTATVCLALEVIENHAYDKSRFLRGAVVDEAKIEREPATEAAAPALTADATPLRWLGAGRTQFELLDKPLVFDEAQDVAYRQPAPLVVIGSAGSGKTAVTLARLREAEGRVLYVTLSAYLAQSARALHAAHGFENPKQEVDFLSYRELLETLRVPPGREVTLPAFAGWCARHRQTLRLLGDIDPQALFEEFRGVIGAQPGGPLSLADYLALGTRQSLLPPAQRELAHGLFQRYRSWLDEAHLYDSNLVAEAWRTEVAVPAGPFYDFIVIDEVQDLTPVQLALVLALLKVPGQFILCGDSHQIVHPNFFSWAALKNLFWQGLAGDAAERSLNQPLQVLQANFRNTRAVTDLANRLLKIKQARFSSVDRESNFLVRSTAPEAGSVVLVAAKDAAVQALDAATRQSAQHAVIVLRDDDKQAARVRFRTPLVFSVHEAKGLEYPHVLLVDIVSGQRQAYAEVCDGVQPADLEADELDYRRAKDKADKSLELYKFYVNALYVAMTRAVQTLTLVEADTGHPLLALLGLQAGEAVAQGVRASTREEWAQEARKLQLQGKEEQAQAIRDAFLQHKPVPWTPWSRALVEELLPKALDPKNPSSKPRQAIFDYALWHGQHEWVTALGQSRTNFAPARQLLDDDEFWGAGTLKSSGVALPYDRWTRLEVLTRKTVAAARQRHLQPWEAKKFKDLLQQADTYGPDHATTVGATPLMMAATAGNAPLVQALLDKGADPQQRDDFGHTAWDCAVSRALQEPGFAGTGLAAVFPLLAPAALDVQTDGRLVRLERRQGEFWLLTLMLAGLKTQWSRCVTRQVEPHKYPRGFFAEQLHDVLVQLPAWLWADKRRKRSYVNRVLARAELSSAYQPARKLWARASNGYYLPNPALLLRSEDAWVRVYELMALDWVHRGCGDGELYRPKPLELVARLGTAGGEGLGEDADSAPAVPDNAA